MENLSAIIDTLFIRVNEKFQSRQHYDPMRLRHILCNSGQKYTAVVRGCKIRVINAERCFTLLSKTRILLHISARCRKGHGDDTLFLFHVETFPFQTKRSIPFPTRGKFVNEKARGKIWCEGGEKREKSLDKKVLKGKGRGGEDVDGI